ncbi:ABC transporter substrate-binding protein [Corynebacterium pygosceleis]|uniref:ABC transporter substrate-binding protein n=1 Tax=Corynebacterium pygosceleis TaxID=2800406 RepID=A0A9Q4GM53_9CORY|nr:ABC transporter substrate-binding protein [Corynebacterium pygosceleis]MCK7638302.1 ABC transporter substrate-binding protein [Corynebacterium pygosceleis]MCK7675282.1 ABC transporter substrate-binding protein [Corynebacterium pygosceleis]MCX7468965.1 ABC transporter substrate-binding protein [Corynebacterium pygosceleis]
MTSSSVSLRVGVLIAAVSVLCSLAGCATASDSPTRTTETEVVESSAGATAQATDSRQISIVHALGTTKLDAPAKTVVALDDPWADAVLMLHGTLLGYADTHAQGTGLGDYLGNLPERFGADAAIVGTPREPDFDAIAALRPDLIVGAKETSGEHYARLSAIAPTVMSEGAPATWKSGYLALGKALGAETAAAGAIAEYEQQARRVGDAIRAGADDPTISVVRFQTGPTRIYAAGSFPGTVLADAGLARPKSQRGDQNFIKVTPDRVGEVDADRIFITMSPLGGERSMESFRSTADWRALDRRTVPADDGVWITSESLPGAYAILGALARAFNVDGPVVPDGLAGAVKGTPAGENIQVDGGQLPRSHP